MVESLGKDLSRKDRKGQERGKRGKRGFILEGFASFSGLQFRHHRHPSFLLFIKIISFFPPPSKKLKRDRERGVSVKCSKLQNFVEVWVHCIYTMRL